MKITGKVALITGGLGGIGLAVTKALLKNGAKAVAIVDLSDATAASTLAALEASFGPNRAIFVKADITNPSDLEAMYEATIAAFNQLDIVFNNAGIINEHNWDQVIRVNLLGTMNSSHLAMTKYLPRYRSGEEAVILNTASVAGLELYESLPSYAVSKHGVVALGQLLGLPAFYEKFGVKILTICPGGVDTTMLANTEKFVYFPERLAADLAAIPAIDTPENMALSFLKVVEEGETGSVWLAENQQPPYPVHIPDKKEFSK